MVVLSGCREQTKAQAEVDERAPPAVDTLAVEERPKPIAHGFRLHEPPPPRAWHVSPTGDRVAARLDDGCGVWRFDSWEFLGVAREPKDAVACERWPTLVPISGTTPPAPLPDDALPDNATIDQLWWEPKQRWFAVEYSGFAARAGGFVVTRDGQLAGLQWGGNGVPKAERASAGWYDGPSPTWIELSLVQSSLWAGYALQIEPAGERPIDESLIFDFSWSKPEPFELLGPSSGRPIVAMKTCEVADDGQLQCKTTSPLPRKCEPVGGWTSYWILACRRAGSLEFVVDYPHIIEPFRSKARLPLPGSDRSEVEWVATEERLAWWSKASGLAIYDVDGRELIAEYPEVRELRRATLDSELELALVRTDAGLTTLDLASAKLGVSLPNITDITAAAFAPDKSAIAVSDGRRVHVRRFSSDEAQRWPASGIAKLAWRQDSKLLLGASVGSGPEQAWEPETGEAREWLAPELRDRLASDTVQIDPTWRWAVVAGSGTKSVDVVEIIRLLDGLSLMVSKGAELNRGAITSGGLYQLDSTKWFLDMWRVGFGSSPLASDWRIETLTIHPANARADLVAAFFAGESLGSPSW